MEVGQTQQANRDRKQQHSWAHWHPRDYVMVMGQEGLEVFLNQLIEDGCLRDAGIRGARLFPPVQAEPPCPSSLRGRSSSKADGIHQ